MKIKKEKIKNDNGTYIEIETIETTPEDGFVRESDMNPLDIDNYKNYHKGYSKSVIFTINDPRIMKFFVYIMSVLFFVIGIIFLILNLSSNNWLKFLGISFILSGILIFIKSKKEIDELEKELKESSNYKEKLSKEEIESYKNILKDRVNDVKKSTFTKNNFNNFLKILLPFYCGISIIIFIIITYVVNIFLGIIVLILLISFGLFYYYVLKKICKY